MNTCHDDGNFIVPSHDPDGASARLTVQIHPGQDRILEYLVDAKRNAFRDKEALIRWCICWGIYTLFGPLPNSISLMEAKMNIFYDERFEEQKDCLGISIHTYVAAGNVDAARRTVALCHQDYSRIACQYWRERWLSTVQEQMDQLKRLGF